MKILSTGHGVGLIVTIIAFATGSFWARSSKTGDESQASESLAGGRLRVASGPSAGSSHTERKDLAGRASTDGRDGRPGSSGTGDGSGQASLSDERVIQSLVRNALKEANPIVRREAFDRLLASLNAENVLMIRAAMTENGAGGDQWRLLDYAWGAVDPAGAIAHLPEIPERYRDGFLGNILPGWASKDPAGAISYLEGMEAGKARDRMTGRLIEGLADRDLGVATRYLFQLADSGDKNAGRHIDTLTRDALRGEGLEGARSWAEDLPAGDIQAAALDRVANKLVASNPQNAAQWATQYAGQDYAWRVIEEVGDEWAERDPSSAVAWLDDLPDGKGRTEGMRSALGEWAKKDAVAAGEYLLEMPESSGRDAAVSGFSRTLAWKDPKTAIQWADSISSKGARIQTLTQVGQAWAHRDKAAAAEWAKNSGLPEKAQQEIMRSRGR